MTTTDQHIRQRALDPTQSFIVQAPAGSGKTELLTQRYLKLLSLAQKAPEEIIAITFTRKAAAEMRERIIKALKLVDNNETPKETHKQHTFSLAYAVLARDQKLEWDLLNNPNRLRILTIDSLCAQISAQIPILSQVGAQPKIIENAQIYYHKAVQNFLTELGQAPAWIDSAQSLLLHLDNRIPQIESLLVALLAKRDQWLHHIMPYYQDSSRLRSHLENTLKIIAQESLQEAKHYLPNEIEEKLIPLAQYASNNLQSENPIHPLAQHPITNDRLTASIEDFLTWQGVANLLLTKEGKFRKSIDKRCGFPAKTTGEPKEIKEKKKLFKSQMKELLTQLKDNEDLCFALNSILNAPPTHYNSQQWEMISALTTLLPICAAHLHVVFQQHCAIDFVELNVAALRALGNPDCPTDLALYLDYKIQHLLVDEFQDTSVTQFNLLELLVSGWQPGDGRSLFFVGDPTQSIYRFRNAEVGLFLRAQQQGIGALKLESLTLTQNFRASTNLVDWINTTFKNVFPHTANIAAGAIPYTPAQAAHQNKTNGAQLYPCLDDQTETIINIIKNIKNPDESIAVLVRSRSHLIELMPALRDAKIDYRAIDIEPLANCMEVQDCLTITRALLHPADRVAWLALLRAPWCGLTLNDLFAIANHDDTIYNALFHPELIASLSKHTQIQLTRIKPVLAQAFAEQGRLSCSQWIEGVWLSLGGPATLKNQDALNNVNAYFKLLSELEQTQPLLNTNTLLENLSQLFAKPENDANAQLQLMTIHKSKGLEFDHVILPSLERKTPYDPNQLLLWLERPNQVHGDGLILAPIKATEEQHDRIYQYCRNIENTKLNFETDRLLYVGTTRAKQSLHLVGTLYLDSDDQAKTPATGSFLKSLWHQYSDHPLPTSMDDDISNPGEHTHPLVHLPKNWKLPALNNGKNPQPLPPILTTYAQPLPIYEPPNQWQRHAGTILHEALCTLAQNKKVNVSDYEYRLTQLGVAKKHLSQALKLIQQGIDNIQQDPRGLWILKTHQDAHCEWALSAKMNQKIIHVIIDRTFIDEHGTRWIIDYKSAQPNHHESLESFTQEQLALYTQQLQLYTNVMRQFENRAIKSALYFPLCKGWIELDKKINKLDLRLREGDKTLNVTEI